MKERKVPIEGEIKYQESHLGENSEVPKHRQKQLTQTLFVCLLESHVFIDLIQNKWNQVLQTTGRSQSIPVP